MFRIVLEPKAVEVIEEWTDLHNEEVRIVPLTIRLRWAGQAVGLEVIKTS
jgi:hypothetical protein